MENQNSNGKADSQLSTQKATTQNGTDQKSEVENTTSEPATEPQADTASRAGKEKTIRSSAQFNFSQILTERSPEIARIAREISELESEDKILKEVIAKKTLLKKPVKATEKKVNGKESPSTEKKDTLKIEIGHLNSRRLWIKERLAELKKQLKSLSKKESRKLDLKRLRDQSISIAYLNKNGYAIKARVLDILNEILKGRDDVQKAALYSLRRVSFYPDSKEFTQAFGQLLLIMDQKTFILSSGKLKDKLYEAVRLTLQLWNGDDDFISKLVFPEDLQAERKVAHDPFIKNRSMIESLILRALNKALESDRESVKSLRTLAEGIASSDEFINKIEEFVDSSTEDLQMISAGGYRSRLNESLRLTLLKWRPEHDERFNQAVLAGAPKDPFTDNKDLLEMIILSFLNDILRKNKLTITTLRDLARDTSKKDDFRKELEEMMSDESSDAHLLKLGVGKSLERLYETIRLTLLKWQPELYQTEFEVVEIAPAE